MTESNLPDRPVRARPVSRRQLLGLIGAVGLSGVAGCTGMQEQTFRSHPVILSREAENVGFWPDHHHVLSGSWERGISDLNVSVSVTSHLVTYGHELAHGSIHLGLFNTPTAAVAGQELNPVASASFEEILSGDVGGRLGDIVDVELAGAVEWWRPPEVVGSFEATVLGEETTLEALAGVGDETTARRDGRESRDLVLSLAARTQRDDQVTIAVLGTSTPVVTDSERNTIVLDASLDDDEENDCVERADENASSADDSDHAHGSSEREGDNPSRTEITEDDPLDVAYRPNPALVSLAQTLFGFAMPLYILRASEDRVVYHTPTGEALDYLRFEFDDVEVPEIEWDQPTGDEHETPTENVSLTFGSVEILYQPQSCQEAASGAVSASWDQDSVSQ